MQTQTNTTQNLTDTEWIDIKEQEASQIIGGGWLRNLYEGIVEVCLWVDYQIRDFKDDNKFNNSAPILREQ